MVGPKITPKRKKSSTKKKNTNMSTNSGPATPEDIGASMSNQTEPAQAITWNNRNYWPEVEELTKLYNDFGNEKTGEKWLE